MSVASSKQTVIFSGKNIKNEALPVCLASGLRICQTCDRLKSVVHYCYCPDSRFFIKNQLVCK